MKMRGCCLELFKGNLWKVFFLLSGKLHQRFGEKCLFLKNSNSLLEAAHTYPSKPPSWSNFYHDELFYLAYLNFVTEKNWPP